MAVRFPQFDIPASIADGGNAVWLDDGVGDVLLADFFPTANAGFMGVFTSGAWTRKPVKQWSGSAWVQKPLKRWNGTDWVLA